MEYKILKDEELKKAKRRFPNYVLAYKENGNIYVIDYERKKRLEKELCEHFIKED